MLIFLHLSHLNSDLKKISNWAVQWQMSFNPDPSLKNISNKVNKTIWLLWELQNILPRRPLLIYKSFFRPHLDYGDVIYDQHYNNSFHHKQESIQYNAALAITGAIRGFSMEKIYQELGLESLRQQRWFRKLCYCNFF